MGAFIPECLSESPFTQRLLDAGLTRIHRGKVRDTYELPGHPEHLLQVATDRLSIFDFVLPGEVPDKGAVLTALTVYWFHEILTEQRHHLAAFGAGLDAFLPENLRGFGALRARAVIIRKLDMVPVECVVRGYLTGSGWSSYRKTRSISGHILPEGLHDGSKLPEALFTPTTKAETGHDEAIGADEVRKEHGSWLEALSLSVYRRLHDHAATRGIILADTKFEFGQGGILGDEVGTPDSSRFWDRQEWERAAEQRRSPSGYDKQPVREWGKTVVTPFVKDGKPVTGIDGLDPEDAEQRRFVHGLTVPEAVLDSTTERYRSIFKRLTGLDLADFQTRSLGL